MGLSNQSVGMNAIDSEFVIKKLNPSDKIIALAGNPNVGKSTVLNVRVIWNCISWSGFCLLGSTLVSNFSEQLVYYH